MRLIDADALKEALHNFFDGKVINEPTYILRDVFCHVDNAPTVEPDKIQAIMKDYLVFRCEPQGKCKTCKHYQPYYKQFSNEPRGDGFCRIVRMAYEGATTINCHDEFSCSDYERGEKE